MGLPRAQRGCPRSDVPASSAFNSVALNAFHLNQVGPENNDKAEEGYGCGYEAASTAGSRAVFQRARQRRKPGHHEKDASQDHHQCAQDEVSGSASNPPTCAANGEKRCSPRPGNPQVSQPTLVPKDHAGQTARSIRDRMKHPRLNGADLYVARFGTTNEDGNRASKKTKALRRQLQLAAKPSPADLRGPPVSASPSDSSSASSSGSDSDKSDALQSPTSLHDELLYPHPKTP